MKKILLTGVSGFIGKNIFEGLQEKYEFYCPSSKEVDLLDTEAVQEYLKKHSFDVVIHAANRNDFRQQLSAYEVLNGNLQMYFNLERCNELYGKMLYFGSGAEYDRRNNVPNIVEDCFDTSIPQDAYGLSKYVMAKSCINSRNIYELCLFGVYGKYEEWERRFISNAICRALEGLDITIKKNVFFDYLWVEDCVRLLPYFIENDLKYKRYNVCRGVKIDLYTLATIVKDIVGVNCKICVGESGLKREYTGNNSRMMKGIGKFKFTDVTESIEELCGYYQKHLNLIDVNRLRMYSDL